VLDQAKPLFEEAIAGDEIKKGSVSVAPHKTKKVAVASH